MKRLSLPFFKKSHKRNLEQHTTSASGIFISYRRSDQPGFAGRLSDQLEITYGKERVFRDVESIAPGENFVSAINASLDCCGALIIIIGPSWLKEHNQLGKPRIFDKDDWVRAELEIALTKKKKIFPILVNGAKMPTADELPKSLHKILEYNAHEISDVRWNYDVNKLIVELTKIPVLEAITPKKNNSSAVGIKYLLHRQRKLAMAGVVSFIVLALAIFVYLFPNESKHCDDIYKQHFTSLSERTEKIRILAGGYLTTSQLHELTESSDAAALNIKTCCIILDKEQITPEQFFQCKTSVNNYSAKVDELIVFLNNNNRVEQLETQTSTADEQKTSKSGLIAIENKLTELLSISSNLNQKVSKLGLVNVAKNEEQVTQPGDANVREGTVNISSIYAISGERIDGEISYYLYETERDAKGERKEVTHQKYKSKAIFTVPPGVYHLWAGHGKASTTQQIEVKPEKTTAQTITIPVGYIKVDAAYADTRAKIDGEISYYLYETERDAKGERKEVTHQKYKSKAIFTVPPGVYHLWAGHGKASTTQQIEVESGKTTVQTITLPVGYIKIDAAYADTRAKIDGEISYYLYETERDAKGERKEVTHQKYKSKAIFTVPPGVYHLWAGHGKASTTQQIGVKSGKTTAQTITIPVGYIRVDAAYADTRAKIDGQISYYLYENERDAKGERKEVTYQKYKSKAIFTVPPGVYHLWADHGKASTTQQIEVKSGKTNEVTVILNILNEG